MSPSVPLSAPLRAPNGRFAPLGAAASQRPSVRPVGVSGPASQKRLTPQQIETLDLVAEGLPNHEIARRLGRSADAITTRLKTAAKTLGTSDRAGMVGECYRLGVFAPRPDRAGARQELKPHLLALLAPVARGLSNVQIAIELGVDVSVVKYRVPVLCVRVGAADRVHLVRRAIDLGLLTTGLELAAPVVAAEPESAEPDPASEPAPCLLSPVQLRVLRMLAFGLEPDAIATRLKVGPGAVRETARAAMVALGARTLPHAILLACQAGILPGGAS